MRLNKKQSTGANEATPKPVSKPIPIEGSKSEHLDSGVRGNAGSDTDTAYSTSLSSNSSGASSPLLGSTGVGGSDAEAESRASRIETGYENLMTHSQALLLAARQEHKDLKAGIEYLKGSRVCSEDSGACRAQESELQKLSANIAETTNPTDENNYELIHINNRRHWMRLQTTSSEWKTRHFQSECLSSIAGAIDAMDALTARFNNDVYQGGMSWRELREEHAADKDSLDLNKIAFRTSQLSSLMKEWHSIVSQTKMPDPHTNICTSKPGNCLGYNPNPVRIQSALLDVIHGGSEPVPVSSGLHGATTPPATPVPFNLICFVKLRNYHDAQ